MMLPNLLKEFQDDIMYLKKRDWIYCERLRMYFNAYLGNPKQKRKDGFLLTKKNVSKVIKKLDEGYVVGLDHNDKYKWGDPIPPNKRFCAHFSTLIKLTGKYYVVQGFVYEYKIKIVEIKDIRKFFNDMLNHLVDNTKTGNRILTKEADRIFKKYFKANIIECEPNGKSLVGTPMYNMYLYIPYMYKPTDYKIVRANKKANTPWPKLR